MIHDSGSWNMERREVGDSEVELELWEGKRGQVAAYRSQVGEGVSARGKLTRDLDSG